MSETVKELHSAAAVFHDSLYIQKHAFFFCEVARWRDILKVNDDPLLIIMTSKVICVFRTGQSRSVGTAFIVSQT